MTTNVQEDYIRALYLLEMKQKSPIKLKNLVEKMGLSKSTVTQRLQDLKRDGWVIHKPYGPVSLSKKGLKKAQNLTFKHRVIELFLIKKLNFSPEEVHEEAHLLEHAFTNKVIQKLYNFLGEPKKCPHGKTIPKFYPEVE